MHAHLASDALDAVAGGAAGTHLVSPCIGRGVPPVLFGGLALTASCSPLPTIKLVSDQAAVAVARSDSYCRAHRKPIASYRRHGNDSGPNRSRRHLCNGYSEDELHRLTDQGRLYAAATRALLLEASVGPGMRVLDVGCGPGDVSLLVAERVGPTGEVVGVDTNDRVLQLAQARASASGATQVRFVQADLRELRVDTLSSTRSWAASF